PLTRGMWRVCNACSEEPVEVSDNEVNTHLGNPGVDLPYGAPPLPGDLVVLLKDLAEGAQEGAHLGLGPRPLLAIAGGLGVVEHLADGFPVEAGLPLDGALALALDEDATPDLAPLVNVAIHLLALLARSTNSATTDRGYPRRLDGAG